MKTTFEISASLLREAIKYWTRRGLTFREVVEAGLRNVLNGCRDEGKPFRLKRAPFHGDGMVGDYRGDALFDLIYESRER